jgi:hypothetical protein
MFTRPQRAVAMMASEKIQRDIHIFNQGEKFDQSDQFNFDNFGKVTIGISKIPDSGYGVYADCEFEKDDVIVEYIGEVFDQRSTHHSSQNYDLTLPECKNYVLRGVNSNSPLFKQKGRNSMKFSGSLVNSAYMSEYKYNAQYQNIETKYVRHTNPDPNKFCPKANTRMFVVATRPIAAGEEVLTNYDWTKWY